MAPRARESSPLTSSGGCAGRAIRRNRVVADIEESAAGRITERLLERRLGCRRLYRQSRHL